MKTEEKTLDELTAKLEFYTKAANTKTDWSKVYIPLETVYKKFFRLDPKKYPNLMK